MTSDASPTRSFLEMTKAAYRSLFPRSFRVLVRSLYTRLRTRYAYRVPMRPSDLADIVQRLDHRPTFSIVVPTYNTHPTLLDSLIKSVREQWYTDWQLILSDDASPSEVTRRYLAGLDDPNITVLFSNANSGISGATNRAIDAARGDYVVFLDHDDELTVDCLYELALAINREQADFVYSDEDKISGAGRFVDPFFKPDWSPDTMMSTMYTCHVSCVRRSLIDQVGMLRSEFDGSQDWDFTLRVTEAATRIAHVPKVLYHWRMIPASAASDLNAKPYALEASRRVREAALERRGLKATLEPVQQVPGHFRVNYAVQGTPLVSIIIPSKNNGAVLQTCLQSIREASTYPRIELVVLDNGSRDGPTLEMLETERQAGTTIVRHDAPFNYSELNNIGVRAATGDVLLFLNDDTEVLSPDWLERMLGYAQLGHVGAVGAKLLYPGGALVQHNGVINLAPGPSHAFLRQPSDAPGYFMRNLLEYNWIAVTGACLMIERRKFNAAGGFDESFPVAYNDIELCFRLINAGFFNVVVPEARLLHHESISRGLDHQSPEKLARLEADRERLYLVHPHFEGHDPFHNPNLNPRSVDFDLAR